MTKIEDWVILFFTAGFSIIPLKYKSKIPNILKWEQFQKRQPTNQEIKKWLKDGLFEGIGIILGAVSGGLEVIDIDDRTLIDKLGINPKTIWKNGGWAVKTGKGYHIYIKHNGACGSIQKPVGYGIERRTTGGYVVAPPSIHPNGKQYQFWGLK